MDKSIRLNISGMTCVNCQNKIKKIKSHKGHYQRQCEL